MVYPEAAMSALAPRPFAIALAAWLAMGPSSGGAGSLRFFGTGAGDVDRVKIPLDAPARPVDVDGAFTVEFWMRALPGENPSGPCGFGLDNWITGHVMVDRDVYGPGDLGDYGLSLFADGVAFGVAVGGGGQGLCGGGDLADGDWHHVAAVRGAGGALSLWVDGALADAGPGPTGDLGYRDGRATAFPASDPYLVLAAEKHDAGPEYPSFSGWLDELRISSVARYTAPFARPAQPFVPDAFTAALYHFDEAAGDTLRDVSGAAGGPSHGVLRVGGAPAGPVWVTDGFPVGAASAPSRAGALALSVAPRPARGAATVTVVLPSGARTRVTLHAADGRLVRVLADAPLGAGRRAFAWDGLDAHGAPVRPGLYFVRAESGALSARGVVVLTR
jgi:hypothetical protein